MKKLYCVNSGTYRKFRNSKMYIYIYIFEKTALSITCSKCKTEDEKRFKEEKSIESLKVLDFIEITISIIWLKKT